MLRQPENAPVRWLSAEQSNSSLIVDDAVMLKLFRKVFAGMHPEAEMSRYLTAQGFANTPPMLGEVVRVAKTGSAPRSRWRRALCAIRAMPGPGCSISSTGRSTTSRRAKQITTQSRMKLPTTPPLQPRSGGGSAKCTRSLPAPPDDAFAPEIASEDDAEAWADRAVALLERALGLLKKQSSWENETAEAGASGCWRSTKR